jgi:pimeloyl-ACP methyl ester carboxylesterase
VIHGNSGGAVEAMPGTDGVPVLVIPGINGSAEPLLAAAPRLFPGLRVVPFDHRLDHADDGIEGLAERALALLDAQSEHAGPVFVCGESFGGPVALTLARRHPERVRGLILLSTFARYPGLHRHGGRAMLAVSRRLGDEPALRAISLARRLRAGRGLGHLNGDAIRWAYLTRPDGCAPAYRRKCEAVVHFDARPWLPLLTIPALVIAGRADRVVPLGAGRELARLIPGAQLHVLPAGHAIPLAHAEDAGRLIARWAGAGHEADPDPVARPFPARPVDLARRA